MSLQKLSIGSAVLVIALALSGCVVFKGPIKANQMGDKPKVAVKFKLCNSHPEPGTICPRFGNSNDAGNPNGIYSAERVLLGFRVPKGSEMPRRIRGRGDVVDGAFEPFRPYARELNANAPARRGLKWFGYSAWPRGEDGGNDDFRYEQARFRAVIGLPDGFDEGVFKLRPVTGWLGFTKDPEFDCGPNPFERVVAEGGSETQVICIDSPSRAKTRRSIRVPIG